MNYEQKYKEALERARDMMSYKEVRREDMEYIFPELKESDDERIREEIYQFLKVHNVLNEEWFNWLEKQGEPKDYGSIDPHFGKPINKVEPKFKVGDFIANAYCRGKVVELTNDAYLLDTGQGIPFSCEHNIHLWTINDTLVKN